MKKLDLMVNVAIVLGKALDKNITKSDLINNKLTLDERTYTFNVLTDEKKRERIELSVDYDGLWTNGCVIAEFCNNIKEEEIVKMLTEVILIYENYMKENHDN